MVHQLNIIMVCTMLKFDSSLPMGHLFTQGRSPMKLRWFERITGVKKAGPF